MTAGRRDHIAARDDLETSALLAVAYDELAYPSGIFPQTSPDRLATIAILHGLTPPPIETARFLELGGGDGLNALAFAASHPQAEALSLDFAGEPVERGVALASAAGLDNARVEKADIVEIAESLEGSFDYIVAHGLYAWVPPIVQRATLRLIGRLLSENGVAFISYNAMPGGHIRMLLRDMMLHHTTGIDDPLERARAGHNYLVAFAERTPEDTPLRLGLRSQAALASRKPEAALAHDEGGATFDPQYLTTIVAAAQSHNLAYLNDAQRSLLQDGFVEADEPEIAEDELLRRIQGHDHERTCFFRESLFIRGSAIPQRRIDAANVAKLWLAFRGTRSGRHVLEIDKNQFEIGDDHLCELLEHASSIYPRRIALASAALQEDQLEALLRVFDREGIELHAEQCPGDIRPDRTFANALARAQITRGDDSVCRFDHRPVTIAEPGPRAFLSLLDGTRDHADLAEAWAATPYHDEISVDQAITMLRGAGLV